MSQNKTVVIGIEDASTKDSAFEGRTSEYYQRGKTNPSSHETIFPGPEGKENADGQNASAKRKDSGKPIVGFLYSISKTNLGEYWPLHIGLNTIGSSAKCDVQLAEGTVSSEHAELVVRQMKNPAKTIASITDARSTNGTMINGESLGFSPIECFNGNVITFGENYQCVLILIDAAALNLKVSEAFIPIGPQNTKDEGGEEEGPRLYGGGSRETPKENFDDPGGTVGMDGNTGKISGGTIGM